MRDELLEVDVAVLVEVGELEDLLHLRRAGEITGDAGEVRRDAGELKDRMRSGGAAARSREMRARSQVGGTLCGVKGRPCRSLTARIDRSNST